MLKKILLLSFIVLQVSIFAQQKVAVYVTGNDAINSIVSSRLADGIAKSGKYIAIERSASFLNELSKEQHYQQTGAVDDSEISRIGKQFGVDYVCVATVYDIWNEKYISARLIHVETAEVIATSSSNGVISNSSQLINVLNTLLEGLLTSFEKSKSQTAKKVAIYVNPTANRDLDIILGDQLVAGFATSGYYHAIERTQGFLSQLTKEQSYQQTGTVDDAELTRLGKQFGVQYICVAKVDYLFGDYFITSRIVDVETAEIVNSCNEEGVKLASSNDVLVVAQKIASVLSNITIKEQQKIERIRNEDSIKRIEKQLMEKISQAEKDSTYKAFIAHKGVHNDHEYMDLGLSIMWATCNVGAKSAEDIGEYFAAGEIYTKECFSEDNYTYTNKVKKTIPLKNDAANFNWGGGWRIPTYEEYIELCEKCTWEWGANNGLLGYWVKGPNGAKIFLPITGIYVGCEIEDDHEYMSSTVQYPYVTTLSCDYDGYTPYSGGGGYYGYNVRAVCDINSISVEKHIDQGVLDVQSYTEHAFGIDMKMIWVEGGDFLMGCTSEQSDCGSDEQNVRRVMVDGFYIGMLEVTQSQWEKVFGTTIYQQRNKSGTQKLHQGIGPDYPMYYVSWDEAMEFCRLLSNKTGRTYTLPTEAQWEYAARGGNKNEGAKYAGSNMIDAVAWYTDNSGSSTHIVGSKRANALGIYDMSGNVWEWCKDWCVDSYVSYDTNNPVGPSSGSSRVLRGGSWYNGASGCRVANRSNNSPGHRAYSLGFRVVLLP